MKVKVLSSKGYEENNKNYGDCIIIYNSTDAVIYDCGSEKHAIRIKELLERENITNVYVILSHNDGDHFQGIQWLRENIEIKGIYTILLLKYVDDIYKKINDKRRSKDAIKEQILELYDNIAKLSGEKLRDIYEESIEVNDVDIVGPSKEYMIESVAKQLDGREGNQIDSETIFNAISVQTAVEVDSKKILLTGDASYSSIEGKIEEYNIIQLPHHGKENQAGKIFDRLAEKTTEVTYIVSDNTGDTNGGSDNLDEKGKVVYNTKRYGDIQINDIISKNRSAGTYGE